MKINGSKNAILRSVALSALVTGGLQGHFDRACAQAMPQPPAIKAIDGNGVNLGTGKFEVPSRDVSIGGEGSGIARIGMGTGENYSPTDNFADSIRTIAITTGASGGPVLANVSYNGKIYRFVVGSWNSYVINQHFNPGTFYDQSSPAILTCGEAVGDQSPKLGACLLTAEDGTTIAYDPTLASASNLTPEGKRYAGYATSIVNPDGEILTLAYSASATLNSVSSSLGWMIKYGNVNLTTALTAINTSVSYCDPVQQCTVSSGFPNVELIPVSDGYRVVRNGIDEVTYRLPPYGGTGYVTKPSGYSKNISRSTSTTNNSHSTTWSISVNNGGSTWNYYFDEDLNVAPGADTAYVTFKTKVVNPNSSFNTLQLNVNSNIILTTDELSRTVNHIYGTSGGASFQSSSKLIRAVPPEGDANGGYTAYTYDTKYRVLTETAVAKYGTGLPNRVVTVAYVENDSTPCVSTKVCNKPSWIRDSNNNQTDFTYSPDHGGVLTMTGPADVSGVRPQTRYTYTQLYPKVRNSGGALINSTPVWRLTKTSACQTATSADPASCVGTAAETVTEYEYNTNNLLRTKVTVRAGNANPAQAYSASNIWQSTAYTYDDIGNVTSVDGPRTDVDDRVFTTYDSWRRPVYEIAPDPDGAGTLVRKIIYHRYDVDGREYRTETGTGSALDGSDFAMKSYTETKFDSVSGLPVKTITVQQ